MAKVTIAQISEALSKEMDSGEVNLSKFQKRIGATDAQMKKALQLFGLTPEELSQKKPSKSKDNLVLTPLDTLYDRLQEGDLKVFELAEEFGLPNAVIESWAALMERRGIAKLTYPVNFFTTPIISKAGTVQSTPEPTPPTNASSLESYVIKADNVPTQIRIFDVASQVQPLYHVTMPRLGPATGACIDLIIEALAENVTVETEDISNPKKITALKEVFLGVSHQQLVELFPKLDATTCDVLSGILLHRAFGLGKLELVMADDFLEEVVVNGSALPLGVYHRQYGWLQSNVFLSSEEEIYNYSSQIGRKIGRQITTLEPIMDAHLLTGDRVNATLFPISSKGNTITIRKFARNPWTITNFIDPKHNTLSSGIAAFLWLAMQYELNVLVAGGTASGKTSILNSICALIPPTQRLLSIEDTRELAFPAYLEWNWVPLTTRNPNPDGKGEVDMLDLMVSALRMRPDRVILGEMRKKREAEVLFEAMHTGHSVYATMHAETIEQVYRRLVEPPMEIPASELDALHIAITQFRDRRTGRRRTYEVAELMPSGYRDKAHFNTLFRWSPRTDKFDVQNKSSRIFQELNVHTGMTEREITQDLRSKKAVLEWMLANSLSDVDQVGATMCFYYKHPDDLLKAVEKKKKPAQVF